MSIAVMPHAVMSSHGRPVMMAMKCNGWDAVSIAAAYGGASFGLEDDDAEQDGSDDVADNENGGRYGRQRPEPVGHLGHGLRVEVDLVSRGPRSTGPSVSAVSPGLPHNPCRLGAVGRAEFEHDGRDVVGDGLR